MLHACNTKAGYLSETKWAYKTGNMDGVCICMHMYVYACICMYMYAYACICICMYMYASKYASMSVCMDAWVYVYMHVCMDTHLICDIAYVYSCV